MKALRLCLLLIWLAGFSVHAQVTKIMGHVTDAQTKEAIPFANILIRGTTIGTLTDFNGNYSLEFKAPADSIRASLIGYQPVTRKFQRYHFQQIDFELVPQQYNLPEVTIKYTGNPADVIIDKVIKNRDKNSLKSFDSYTYKAYTKIEVDANNITDKLMSRKIFKPFNFVFDYVDTSTINGKSFLPVLLSETNSDIYYRKTPRARKEIITATKVSGIENTSVSTFLGNLSELIDIYKDYVMIFEKNFTSPISASAFDFYKYYLVDSSYIDNNWCYHIMFKPKRKQELTFTGSIWITDTTWAVKRVEMRIAEDANINFVNDLAIRQEYTWTQDKFWMLTRDQLSVDFNIMNNAKKTLGFFAHRTIIYSDFVFDPADTKRFTRLSSNVTVEEGADTRNEAYWDENRADTLSGNEKNIYSMVDSVKKIPVFKTYTDIIYTALNGYLPWGKVELGPYFKIFSYNGVEGARFRIGARTSNTFSKKVQLEAYVAYGTWDKTFKYGGELIWMLDKNPRRDFTLSYKYDLEQLGLSPTALSTDNLLTSLFHRGPNNKLTMVREYKVGYEHEWFTGLINTLWLTHREVFPLGNTTFVIYPENRETPVYIPNIFTTEIKLDTRISFHERFVMGEFYRYTLSSNYPILLISYAYGIPNLFGSDYEYSKLNFSMTQWFNFSSIGWSRYIIDVGKIWGTLPYPLLKIHDGNQTFFFDEYSSNLMNYYEFVSDEYISVYYTHHFDGLLLNHIPLMRKLKWREVAHIRCVYGTLTTKNAEYSLFPGQMRSFAQKPYWETGVGIENILKFIRVDAIWRLSHRDDAQNPNVPNFGLFVSLFFQF